ncbi:hypothetical protein [Clostridium weizhouense]|uniref:Uncharacterized protein n=1 Tax=Clostridium weizhouense TaxID=2859781 RepID=A0ABS7AQL1_9CLOT|nr:hypothetical protein [Clostridium weizhouense]MBW6410960.1 hypothetical protein [Clostridium weizhouense]
MKVDVKRTKYDEFIQATLTVNCAEFTKIQLALKHYKKELEKLNMTEKVNAIDNILKEFK